MTALNEKISGLEMDFQNLISCIQCHEDENNVDVIIESLKTIVTICSDEKLGKAAFYDVGGLDFLLNFIINTDQVSILEYGFKVLAFVTDGNVNSQMYLTNHKVFTILKTTTERTTYPLPVLKNALVLFSTILFQNRAAQDLIQEDAYIQSLINQYKHYAPPCSAHSHEDPELIEIWLSISSTLCFAVNNPINEQNQEICAVLFPISLKVIETSTDPHLIDASSSFMSLCISNNEKNQNIFAEHDGFLILKCCLNRNFELIKSYMKQCNNVVSKVTLQTLNSLVGIISAAVLSHGKNAALCGKLGIVSQMIELLSTDVLNNSIKKKVILALAHSIDAYSDNRFIVLDVPQFDTTLNKSFEDGDQELHSAANYLLQLCLKGGGNTLKMDNSQEVEVDDSKPFLESFHDRFNGESSNHNLFAKVCNREELQKNIYCKGSQDCDRCSDTVSEFQDGQSLVDSFSCSDHSHNPTAFNPQPFHKVKGVKSCLNMNKHSNEDSLSEISLQSAGHLYRLKKRKMKDIFQSKISKNSNSTFGFLREISNVISQAKRKRANFSTCSSLYKTKCKENKNGAFNKEILKQQQDQPGTVDYNITGQHLTQNANFPKASMQNCTKSFDKCYELVNHVNLYPKEKVTIPRKNSLTHCSKLCKSHSYSEIDVPYEHKNHFQDIINTFDKSSNTSEFLFSKSMDTQSIVKRKTKGLKDHLPDRGIVSNNYLDHECSSKPYSHNRIKGIQKTGNEKLANSKISPPGCIQAVVLPGARCPLHKLAAHFEFLKVCPI